MNLLFFVFIFSSSLLSLEQVLQLEDLNEGDKKPLVREEKHDQELETTACIICFEGLSDKEKPYYFCTAQFEGPNHSEKIHTACQLIWIKKQLFIKKHFCRDSIISQTCAICREPLITKQAFLKLQKKQKNTNNQSRMCSLS
jgi:hypothetical protein